jgi:2-succinyl-5-enolpyruvyl-6-hydroxy-3-cyclohexene-1-carboxylate synthase
VPPIAGSLDTHLLLRAFVDELARCGVAHACTSPGSRSAPLALALSRDERIRTWSHIDERSAGFFALGLAKTTGRAVVLACTSGTAAANYGPAVHEAREARVPLIVLTADRPPELRDTGAGQTIDQLDLYGRAATWFAELDLAEATPERARWTRRMGCRAVWTAEGPRPGVVHLNVPLREPLVPGGPLPPGEVVPGRADGAPWVARAATTIEGAPLSLPSPGIVVAGAAADPDTLAWAAAAGWPVLADPLSGLRHGPNAIAHGDLLAPLLPAPAAVVRTGDLPTAKRLRQRLAGLDDAVQVALDPESAWQDPDGAVTQVHPGPISALRAEPAQTDWLDRWRAADAAATGALEAELGDGLSEPAVARFLASRLGADETLWVASSMPIRDVEAFAPLRDDAPRVVSNRGANGIDGTISSAYGARAGGDGPVTLLIGDVAMVHDAGGLLAHRRHGLDVRIVVIDNDGGGIFHFLPVAERLGTAGEAGGQSFTEHVATPHGTDLEALAAAAGVPYSRAERLEDLLAPGMVHVRTDREENLALHRHLSETMERAVTSL